jgi:tRNA nucleotidyltransferase (CCA-adding enzyme)
MDVSATFKVFIENLAVANKEEISNRYKRITKTLNKEYWGNESETYNSLFVGSYDRGTAINGISDVDMVVSLPWLVYYRFNSYETNGQSALLQEVKGIIKATYSRTDIRGDGQVVVVREFPRYNLLTFFNNLMLP